MKRVYLLMVVAVLCIGADAAFAQPGDAVSAPAVLVNNSHVNKTIDFGFVVCEGVIGDLVWKDINGNGIQDDGNNTGISGAVVTLLNATTGNSIPGIEPFITNDSGIYLFEGLCAGNYIVTVVPPSANYKPTTPNQGNNDSTDSDGEV